MIPAGIWRPKVVAASTMPRMDERIRRMIGFIAWPVWQRPRKSLLWAEHSWKRVATSSEDCGLGISQLGSGRRSTGESNTIPHEDYGVVYQGRYNSHNKYLQHRKLPDNRVLPPCSELHVQSDKGSAIEALQNVRRSQGTTLCSLHPGLQVCKMVSFRSRAIRECI
jgi:hypothetical protein